MSLDHQPTTATATRDSTLRVAVTHPSGRVDKVTAPMRAAGVDVAVAPDAPEAFDAVLLDTPGRAMIPEILRRSDTPVVYRIRGNLWRASQYWFLGALKSELSDRVLFPRLDGAIPADPYLETEFQSRTENTATDAIGLPIDAAAWPTVEHTDHALRLVTLTNADYRGKVEPITERVGLVDDLLAETGGRWVIGGDGRYTDRLRAATADADHVTFGGFLDAEQALADANVLYHPSEFDIQLPNAVLEGMAAGLPVVTTAFPPFAAHRRLRAPRSPGELRELLRALVTPARRREEGDRNRAYVADNHDPATIGAQYRNYFETL